MHAATLTLALLASVPLLAQQQEQDPPPRTFTFAELCERPELWPEKCSPTEKVTFEDFAIGPDDELPIVTAEDGWLRLLLRDGSNWKADPTRTDFVARANAAFAAMSPEQRAVDQEFLRRRADLWPDQIKLRTEVRYPNVTLPIGTEMTLGRVTDEGLVVRHAKFDHPVLVFPWSTDFPAQVRAALADKARKPSHWILSELEKALVTLPTGRKKRSKKVKVNLKRPPEYTVLFFGADWCGHCHKFVPKLKAFYKQNKRHVGRKFQLIWVSRDKSETEQLAYAHAQEFAWPAVKWTSLEESPRTQMLSQKGIPHLVVLDQHGSVVLESYEGELKTADAALAAFGKLLKAPKRRR